MAEIEENIYGKYYPNLAEISDILINKIQEENAIFCETKGRNLYEHINSRIKTDESMRAKCRLKGLEESPKSALYDLKDAIGIRIVCSFVDDIYDCIDIIKGFENCQVVEEKDYIKHAKANGYRSYHLILDFLSDHEDVNGNKPGHYFVELQLRTIAMDTWAALEHQMKYKKDISNQDLIVSELKRCADELASCDLSLQTIRNLINSN